MTRVENWESFLVKGGVVFFEAIFAGVSQTPPSLRATSPNLGEELSYLARRKANSELIF